MTYVLALCLVATLAWGLSVVGVWWRQQVVREYERDLIFAGQQFREALNRYARESPTGTPRHPEKLEDLLADRRSGGVRRHLRRVFPDPFTGSTRWGLVRQGGRIVGVYSEATGRPLMKAGFPKELAGFAMASSYADWQFVADGVQIAPRPDLPVGAGGAPAAAAGSGGPAPPRGGAPVEPEIPSIPNRPTPCLAEYDAAVARCWSDAASAEQNAACEASAQRVANACTQQRLYGPR